MLTVLGVILLVVALFLVVSVLMQHGKAKQLSGTIAGGAETFFGKNKGSSIDRMLSKVTSIVAVVFVIIVIVVYITQDTAVEDYKNFEEAINTKIEDVADDASADTGDAEAAGTEAAE